MSYWLRELAGWLLVALGLFVFFLVIAFGFGRRPIEAGLFLVVGVFVYRGGIHLLKVAVAARICQQAQDRLYPASPRPRR